nr:YlxR family protein [Sanguibacter suarezii]
MGRHGRLSESGSPNPTSTRASARSAAPSTSSVEGSGPVRTCVGCRQRDSQAQMIRFVAGRSETTGTLGVVADLRRVLPGRGAWLHASTECGELAIRRNAFPRALRASTGIEDLTRTLGSVSHVSTTRRQGSGL